MLPKLVPYQLGYTRRLQNCLASLCPPDSGGHRALESIRS